MYQKDLFPHGRFLLCEPYHYDVRYQINPWMDTQKTPHHGVSWAQWTGLHHLLLRSGAWVEYIEQQTGLPDMVFTANGGLVKENKVVTARFRHKERQGEEPHYRRWFEEHGFEVVTLRHGDFEGEGDALFAGDLLVAGHGFRSDPTVYEEIAAELDVKALAIVELVDPRFYHLDTCFAPLKAGLAMLFPGAISEASRAVLDQQMDLILIPEHDALRFACNSLVLGSTVIMPAGCYETKQLLEGRGFRVISVDLGEFIKAGGAAKCLSLKLLN